MTAALAVLVVFALAGPAEVMDGQVVATPAATQEPAAPAAPQLPAAPVRPVAPAAPAAPQEPQPPAAPDAPPAVDDFGRRGDQVVRVGTDYTLPAGERADEIVVVMGAATVEGRIRGDLVVVLGEARLGPAASVDGDVVVIGGNLTVDAGGRAARDVVVIGGAIESAASFMPGGEQVVVGFRALGDHVRGLLPWLGRGLLYGRPIVPDLGWVWALVLTIFLIYLLVLLVFDHPVRVTADALVRTPLKAMATGVVVLLVLGPLLLLLAVSVIGLLVVPVALCAVFVAGLVGRIAVARWLGARLVREGDEESRALMARSFVIGSVLLVATYAVPILGGVVWALAGATGLGAATLAFVAAYRKENPPPPAPQAPIPPPLPPPAPAGGAPSPLEGPAAPAFSAAGAAGAEAGAAFGAQVPASAVALFPRASFTDRLAALVLDAILVAIAIGLLDPLDDEMFIPLFLGYRFAFWAWKSATVGGIICQTRVVRLDGSRVGPADALVRSITSLFSFAVLGIGCLWMLRDAEQQTWHDKIAGTAVVKVPRNWPL